jgi:hypothetical protein
MFTQHAIGIFTNKTHSRSPSALCSGLLLQVGYLDVEEVPTSVTVATPKKGEPIEVTTTVAPTLSADPRLSPQPHFPPAAFPGGKPTAEKVDVREGLLHPPPAAVHRHIASPLSTASLCTSRVPSFPHDFAPPTFPLILLAKIIIIPTTPSSITVCTIPA